MRKIVSMCELHGVRTAFQEGGENDPVNQMAAYHIDISTPAFGIQEENHFPPIVHEMMPGAGQFVAAIFTAPITQALASTSTRNSQRSIRSDLACAVIHTEWIALWMDR